MLKDSEDFLDCNYHCFVSGKVRVRVRDGQVGGAEFEREGQELGERSGRDAQGRGEQEGDREAAQGSSGKGSSVNDVIYI